VNVRIGLRRDKGRRRLINEDRVYCNEAMGLFILADGMGGHRVGEVASSIAVETIAEKLNETLSSNNCSTSK